MPAVRDRSGRLTELRTHSGRVVWGRSGAPRARRQRITAAGTTATVYLYDEIGQWGVSAAEFVPALDALDAKHIDLRINSPGGDVYDGLAIYEAIRRHPAKVTAHVEGLAASAASFIAMGADRIEIGQHSELMIHDAWGLCVGNEADMLAMATTIGRCSDNLAAIYAERAGGTPKDWRKAMKAESWYSGAEAVTAGLADAVTSGKGTAEPEPEEELAELAASLGPSLRTGLAQAFEDRRQWNQVERLAAQTTGDGLAVAIAEGLAS